MSIKYRPPLVPFVKNWIENRPENHPNSGLAERYAQAKPLIMQGIFEFIRENISDTDIEDKTMMEALDGMGTILDEIIVQNHAGKAIQVAILGENLAIGLGGIQSYFDNEFPGVEFDIFSDENREKLINGIVDIVNSSVARVMR